MQTFEYSKDGLALTESFEGLRLMAYQDVVGVWTVGFGHTGVGVRAGLAITQVEAEILLRSDIAASVLCVNSAVSVTLNQRQFDALVDFCFNVGRGNFLQSTLLRKVNAGDFSGAAEQFGAWVYAGGEVISGLVRRRQEEARIFSGDAGRGSRENGSRFPSIRICPGRMTGRKAIQARDEY